MTTVVGFAFGQSCVIAADSMTNVYDRPVPGIRKVLRHAAGDGGEFLLGFAGDGAGPSIVRQHLTVETLPDVDDERARNSWASAVAQAITQLYAEHLLFEDGRMDSNLLLGAGGHLWTVTHMQAIAHLDGLGAIGSGEGPALGALHAYLDAGTGPVEAVTKACRVGIELDRYSGGESVVETLGDLAEARPPILFVQ